MVCWYFARRDSCQLLSVLRSVVVFADFCMCRNRGGNVMSRDVMVRSLLIGRRRRERILAIVWTIFLRLDIVVVEDMCLSISLVLRWWV